MSSLLLSFVLYSQKLQLVAESELLQKRIDELCSVNSGVEKVRSSFFPPSRQTSQLFRVRFLGFIGLRLAPLGVRCVGCCCAKLYCSQYYYIIVKFSFNI